MKKYNSLVLQYVSIATVYEECKLKLIIKKSNWFLKQNTCFDFFKQYLHVLYKVQDGSQGYPYDHFPCG